MHSLAQLKVLLYFRREVGVPRAPQQQSAAVEDLAPAAFNQSTPRLALGSLYQQLRSATADSITGAVCNT